MTRKSLFERIGGEAAVMAAVERFYAKVLADERTRRFFEGMNMTAQTDKQVAFMMWAFGGPAEYRGRDLRSAHAGLVEKGLGDVEFDAVAELLASTLREMKVAPELIEEALSIVAGTRSEVLGRQ